MWNDYDIASAIALIENLILFPFLIGFSQPVPQQRRAIPILVVAMAETGIRVFG